MSHFQILDSEKCSAFIEAESQNRLVEVWRGLPRMHVMVPEVRWTIDQALPCYIFSTTNHLAKTAGALGPKRV